MGSSSICAWRHGFRLREGSMFWLSVVSSSLLFRASDGVRGIICDGRKFPELGFRIPGCVYIFEYDLILW